MYKGAKRRTESGERELLEAEEAATHRGATEGRLGKS